MKLNLPSFKLNFNLKLVCHIIGSFARTLLGLLLIFSGFVKAVDPLGTSYKIQDYLEFLEGFFLKFMPFAEWLAYGLIAFEFILGVLLLFNVWTKITSWFTLAFMLVMTAITLYIAIYEPISDCGCFGDAVKLTNWQTFYKNIVLMVLVIMLLCTKKYIPTTFQKWAEWSILGVAVAGVATIMLIARLALPIIDFRPYKVGTNLYYEIYEKNRKGEVYNGEFVFVYEKDGVTKEFTLAQLQEHPEYYSWNFIERREPSVEKEAEPSPYDDFILLAEAGVDIKEAVLTSKEPVTLIIMYDLSKANRKQAAKINQLYKNAQSKGQEFYAVTGSSDEDIEKFIQEMKAEYPFLNCDGTALKTVIRANPGMMVIQNGIIIDKKNLRQVKIK